MVNKEIWSPEHRKAGSLLFLDIYVRVFPFQSDLFLTRGKHILPVQIETWLHYKQEFSRFFIQGFLLSSGVHSFNILYSVFFSVKYIYNNSPPLLPFFLPTHGHCFSIQPTKCLHSVSVQKCKKKKRIRHGPSFKIDYLKYVDVYQTIQELHPGGRSQMRLGFPVRQASSKLTFLLLLLFEM